MRLPEALPCPEALGRLLLACTAILAARASAQTGDADVPFRVSENHRFIADLHGTPFLLQGDAAWSLIANATKEDVKVYLQNRRSKGFNAILVNLIEHKFAKSAPKNAYGEAPFPDPSDLGVTNEKYFEYADWVIGGQGRTAWWCFSLPCTWAIRAWTRDSMTRCWRTARRSAWRMVAS